MHWKVGVTAVTSLLLDSDLMYLSTAADIDANGKPIPSQVQAWDSVSQEQIHFHPGLLTFKKNITSLSVSHGTLYIGSLDAIIRVVDISQPPQVKSLCEINTHVEGPVNCLEVVMPTSQSVALHAKSMRGIRKNKENFSLADVVIFAGCGNDVSKGKYQ